MDDRTKIVHLRLVENGTRICGEAQALIAAARQAVKSVRAAVQRTEELAAKRQSGRVVAPCHYPRRQWPLCPRCSSRDAILDEDRDHFVCVACGDKWAVPPSSAR